MVSQTNSHRIFVVRKGRFHHILTSFFHYSRLFCRCGISGCFGFVCERLSKLLGYRNMISFVLDRYLDDGYGYGGCVGPFFPLVCVSEIDNAGDIKCPKFTDIICPP